MSFNETIVMFDLEQTIVDTWSNGVPLISNLNNISYQLVEYKDFLNWGIFSFACDNESEKSQAISMAKSAIECCDNLKQLLISAPLFCPSFEDLTKLPKVAVGLEKWELVNIYGKKIMFEMWTKQYAGKNFILFDDTLDGNESIIRRVKGQCQILDFIKI